MNSVFLWADRALFVGPVKDNRPHEHFAVQVTISRLPFRLDIGQSSIETCAAIVDSQVKHKLDGKGSEQIVLLLDYDSTIAQRLKQQRLLNESFLDLNSVHFDWDLLASDPSEFDPLAITDKVIATISPDSMVEANQEVDARITKVCNYIAAKPDYKVTLAELAGQIALSEGRLTHLFKEQVGIPIRRYVMWLRIRKCIQLVASSKTLTEAAHSAGFSDQAHFTRTFKDMFGLTPQEVLSAKSKINLRIF